MNRKTFRIFLILLAAMLMLAGCGRKETPAENQNEAPEQIANDVPASNESNDAAGSESNDVIDSMDELESLLDDAATAYADLAAATEGMTKDEAIEYWIREALKLVENELPEVRQEKVQEALDQLYAAGIMLEQAIYDAENLLFTFGYESGILGGVSLKETSPIINSPGGSAHYAPTLHSAHTDAPLQAVLFNGFEDIPYRTDFYNALYSDWTELGVGFTLDSTVTVADLANLAPYDVVVFSMHGTTYLDQPTLCINEVPSAESDQLYYDYLVNQQSVAKVIYVDGSSGYCVLPSFFSYVYGSDGLDGKIFYAEACCFYGCDCYCTEPDATMGSALINASAEAVMGYYNSVEAGYSRNMMRRTLEDMYNGVTVYDALSNAIGAYGSTDNWEDASQHKYIAYPVYMGNPDAVIVTDEVPEEEIPEEIPEEVPEDIADILDDPWFWLFAEGQVPPKEEVPEDKIQIEIELPDDPSIDWTDYNYASERVYNSLMDQLIGVYAEAHQDGTFYLPYINDTGYTFSVTIDLEYLYGGSTVFEDTGYVYTLEPGDYIEIPVFFPEYCDAWNLWFVYGDIYYEGIFLG